MKVHQLQNQTNIDVSSLIALFKNEKSMIFIVILGISLIQFLDIKLVISIIALLLIVLNYEKILPKSNIPITPEIKNKQKYEITDDMNYNTTIETSLHSLSKFKKYNKVSYKEGIRYMKLFLKMIHILEQDKINNYNHYFENATIYLKDAMNNFQSITVSLPERTLLNAIKYNDYEVTKKANKLSSICKELYKECHYILVNLSIKFNKKWNDNPNINNKEITINTDNVEYNNEYDNKWSIY